MVMPLQWEFHSVAPIFCVLHKMFSSQIMRPSTSSAGGSTSFVIDVSFLSQQASPPRDALRIDQTGFFYSAK
jgi:hypothetical protein